MLIQPRALADLANKFHADGWQVVCCSYLDYQDEH